MPLGGACVPEPTDTCLGWPGTAGTARACGWQRAWKEAAGQGVRLCTSWQPKGRGTVGRASGRTSPAPPAARPQAAVTAARRLALPRPLLWAFTPSLFLAGSSSTATPQAAPWGSVHKGP